MNLIFQNLTLSYCMDRKPTLQTSCPKLFCEHRKTLLTYLFQPKHERTH